MRKDFIIVFWHSIFVMCTLLPPAVRYSCPISSDDLSSSYSSQKAKNVKQSLKKPFEEKKLTLLFSSSVLQS